MARQTALRKVLQVAVTLTAIGAAWFAAAAPLYQGSGFHW